jgi:hypothetical protein
MSTPAYTYIPSQDFINNLAFEYIETYSFQRGKAFEEAIKKDHEDFEILNVRKHKKNDLASEEEKHLEDLLSKRYTQYLINEKGDFHPSAEKTNIFKHADPVVEKLNDILLTEVIEIPRWLCAPTYRDAIVFYDSGGRILTQLNVCLGCRYMETKMFNNIDADNKTYDLLKTFFKEIGHNVEP